MTPERQRIAIAAACGRRVEQWTEPSGAVCLVPIAADGYVDTKPLPDYLNDLNAMREAWLTLDANQRVQFSEHLNQIVARDMRLTPYNDDLAMEGIVENAKASQRAEAFLRTLNKWEDS